MEKVSVQQVKELKDQGERTELVNVLPKDSFNQEHIPGSINIPFDDKDAFIQQINKLLPDKNAKVVLYCSSTQCPASGNAAKVLEKAGYRSVYHFKGGIEAWKEAHEEVVSGQVMDG